MIIIMESGAEESDIQAVISKLNALDLDIHRSDGVAQVVIGAIGLTGEIELNDFKLMKGVSNVIRISEPYKLASRAMHPEKTIINIRGEEIGGEKVVVMAGPCSVESKDHIMRMAEIVSKAGAKFLRGGAYKPRTSPYSFQGLGEEGLIYMREAADMYDMAVVTEIMDPNLIPLMSDYTDIFQVGARNMQNYQLLKELGKSKIPVLLKRGLSATIEEWLMSAEYIMAGGNQNVILCERGIRTFEGYTRNTFDVSAIPVVQGLSHLPIIADPSHATGIRDKVSPVARASVAAGADGMLIEVHDNPEEALSDGAQSLYPEQFTTLMNEVRIIASAVGRTID
ncbi:3-deoxy-7-phosphoheptulonate synthase [Candidatus Marinimicrobia bacterium MT.SAG.2]|nr:3-deoxy-7-phosphoheptulonate synthase [Candidatus Marinimicrobia bacterium MT.SAG.2]